MSISTLKELLVAVIAYPVHTGISISQPSGHLLKCSLAYLFVLEDSDSEREYDSTETERTVNTRLICWDVWNLI